MKTTVALILLGVTLVLPACGGGSDSGSSSSSSPPAQEPAAKGLPDCRNGDYAATPERVKRADAEGGMTLDEGLVILPGEECSLDGYRTAVGK